MFSFYPNRKRLVVNSNPELPDLVVIEPLIVDGVVTNKARKIPCSNKSLLDGAVYDSSTMSLRALLNNGVQLSFVPNGSRDSDPLSVYNRINYMSNTITTKYAQLLAESAQSNVEPEIKSE